MNIVMALGFLVIAFFAIAFLMPGKVAAIIISIISVIFVIYCSIPKGSGSADEGEIFLNYANGTDTQIHTVNTLFNLKYSLNVEPLDPNQPYFLEFVISDSEEGLYDTEKNKEYKFYDSNTDSSDVRSAMEKSEGEPAKIKVHSWGWWVSNPTHVDLTVNGVKMEGPVCYPSGETFVVLRGNNVHVTDLRFSYHDGFYVGFHSAIGAFLVDYIGPFVGSGLLFLLILVGICAVSGLICGRYFPQGVLSGVIGLMLGQILMDLWVQIPLLRGAYEALTGFMNTIGERFGIVADFKPYSGVGGIVVLVILMIVRIIILIYALSMKRITTVRTIIAFILAFILQGILYAPIYYLQSQFLWLALGLIVVIGAVLIIGGTGWGFFNAASEGIAGEVSHSSGRASRHSDDWGIEAPSGSGLFYGDNGSILDTSKDPNGNTLVWDDEGHSRIARETDGGWLIDDDGNHYRPG